MTDPTRVALAAAVALAISTHVAPALASPHEIYGSAAGSMYSSSRRLMAGAGFGIGYRLHFADRFAVYAELNVRAYLGAFGVGTVGLMVRPLGRREVGWDPGIALQGSVYFGDRLAILDSTNASDVPPVAYAVQLRLALLRFRSHSWTAAALVLEGGVGLEQGSIGLAFGAEILEVGYRF